MRRAPAIAFGFLFAASAPVALACSCPRNPTAEGLLATSAAVFTGTVRAVESIGPGLAVTTFVVTETFKGPQRGTVVNVHHASSAAPTCGVKFEYGRAYTLAASRERGALWTSRCSTWMFEPGAALGGELVGRMRSLRGRP